MTHVDRSVFTDEDYRSIRKFVGMLNDAGVGAALLDYELGTHKNSNGDPLVPIRACLSDVIRAKPENMHEAGFSFAEIFASLEKMDIAPSDFMPSEDLVERLLEQFWNYQRDNADEAEAKASADSVAS